MGSSSKMSSMTSWSTSPHAAPTPPLPLTSSTAMLVALPQLQMHLPWCKWCSSILWLSWRTPLLTRLTSQLNSNSQGMSYCLIQLIAAVFVMGLHCQMPFPQTVQIYVTDEERQLVLQQLYSRAIMSLSHY